MSRFIDLTNQKLGRLTVIKRVDQKTPIRWLCQCECGNFKEVYATHLRSGNTRSCGCLAREIAVKMGHQRDIGKRSFKHGDFGTKLYGIWAGMKRRCYNRNTKYYADYGGRGIKVCEEWKEYINFKQWAVSAGYKEGLTIERINVDFDYSPDNCKWISIHEQNLNKRNSVRIEYQGKIYSMKEIAAITGLKERTIKGRYERGWTTEKLFDPTKHKSQY